MGRKPTTGDAGKGDGRRPEDKRGDYSEGYDRIEWKKKPIKKENT